RRNEVEHAESMHPGQASEGPHPHAADPRRCGPLRRVRQGIAKHEADVGELPRLRQHRIDEDRRLSAHLRHPDEIAAAEDAMEVPPRVEVPGHSANLRMHRDFQPLPSGDQAETVLGGSNTVIGGSSSSHGSISTRALWAMGPWPRREVPLSIVRVFALPCLSRLLPLAGSSGSYQAPVASCTTPGMTRSVITAPASTWPRPLNTRTTSPALMPRASASAGWIQMGSRPLILLALLTPPLSSWPCRRVRG